MRREKKYCINGNLMEENRKKNGRIAQKIPLKNKEVGYELLKKYAIIY